ncbi:hypothetical protein PGH12_05340 [Chryseobacterium wangxinyae]|uniref:hypothetical protein n=1 Tax=Chryseobacterium sp. CY350 TaxID=2997336 RepID=UPI00226EA3B5|nr:hypothetical protein [Chryseobacterium sp. CY350]MCY0976572.1 hypothetical protein [Chryseobacterium sp. CY350]WBZ96574.1 hypothetical protein PGH12_05340 [Chryseobacterium sp. CY350]
MNNIKKYFLPVLILYLALMCLYVSYLFIIDDYNIMKSIYQPYKTFIQLSPFNNWNIFITILKGIFGVAGFIKYMINRKLINYFNTLFLVMTVFEIVFQLCNQIVQFKNLSIYVDLVSTIFTAILFLVIGFYYFKNAKIKEVIPQILLGISLTVISYHLH